MTSWSEVRDRAADAERREARLEGDRLAREGAERAYFSASELWKVAARETFEHLAQTRREFTSDDVWISLKARRIETVEHRAMAGVVRWAEARGLIQLTDRMVKSVRPECHSKPTRVYRSRVLRG